MEAVKNMEKTLKKIFGDKSKAATTVLVLGVLGIVLILLSEFLPASEKQVITQKEENFISEKELESRISNIISKIEGTGKTEVMIMLDSSKEYFYAENYTEDKAEGESTREKEIVTVDGELGEEPIIIKSTEAKVRGILVICEGGGNALVREKIIAALCALLNIPSTRVSVAEMA